VCEHPNMNRSAEGQGCQAIRWANMHCSGDQDRPVRTGLLVASVMYAVERQQPLAKHDTLTS
jgi:hypothetical protein